MFETVYRQQDIQENNYPNSDSENIIFFICNRLKLQSCRSYKKMNVKYYLAQKFLNFRRSVKKKRLSSDSAHLELGALTSFDFLKTGIF